MSTWKMPVPQRCPWCGREMDITSDDCPECNWCCASGPSAPSHSAEQRYLKAVARAAFEAGEMHLIPVFDSWFEKEAHKVEVGEDGE